MERSWPEQDLRAIVELGLERGGHILTDSERAMAECILEQHGEPALLIARLTSRMCAPHRCPDLVAAGVEEVGAALEALLEAGLVAQVDDPVVVTEAATGRVLAEGCRRLGLKVSGSRAELQERLADRGWWDDAAWVEVSCWSLVHRLTRWAHLKAWPDRNEAVLERMGIRVWPVYTTTCGAVLPSRERWLAWEALVEGWEALTPQQALEALAWPDWPPAGLDLRRRLVRWLTDHARELERLGDYGASAALLDALLATGTVRPGRLAVRRARVMELGGDAAGALALLRHHLQGARDADGVAMERAGRRVARLLRESWAPRPPRHLPRERHLKLSRSATEGPRPLWGDGLCIEDAVAAQIREAGRTVLRGEGPLFRTLFGLLLLPALFAPIPGQLPVPRLSGPLDGWTPEFAARRATEIWEVWDAIGRGEAPRRLVDALDAHHGEHIQGVRWERASRSELVSLAAGLGPRGLQGLLGPLLMWGGRETRGLPDLVVLPGRPCRVPGVFPSKVASGLVLVEVKGPTDTVRDAQEVWFDRLFAAGVAVEVWHVTER